MNEYIEEMNNVIMLIVYTVYNYRVIDESENCIISDFYKLYENILKITEKMKIYEKKMLLKFKFRWLIKEIKYYHNFYDDEKIINAFTYDVSVITEKGGLL